MRHAEQGATCAQEAATLLPWYTNGTLNPEERRAVEDHLATCPLCPYELVDLLKVQAVLRRELAEAPEPSVELLQTVKAKMTGQAAPEDRLTPFPSVAQARSPWAWVNDWLRPAPRPGWALAALVLLTVQTAVIVGLVARWPSGGGSELRTLSGPTTPGQPSGPQVRLRVAFKEEAPERAIRTTLADLKATIVDGPSAAGFYLIDVPLLNGPGRSRDQVLRVLRGRSEVIRFAEVAGG